MTIYALPLTNKLSGTYTKTVSFTSMQCKANNQYQRKMGVGKDNLQISYELKYIGLTQSEVSTVETLFSIQSLGDVISFKSPIDSFAKLYAKPTSWQKENYYGWAKDHPYQKLTDLSFTLVLGNELTPIAKTNLIPPPPNPPPSIPYTDVVYSPIDSRIYVYSKPSQKLYIFSSSLSLISEVQTDWGTTFDWSTMLVSDSGLILFQKYGANSAGHIYTYDPITDSLGLFSDGQPQAVSIYTEGDYVYKAYFWYTVNTVTRLNLKTSEVLASTPVSNTLNLAITVFDNAVWVLSTGYGRDYMTIDKLSMDLQTVLASYPVPNSAGYQGYHELKLANGKLWFTTYSSSPTTSIILRSFNPTTEVFESYSDAKLNIGQAEVLGNYLYLMSMTGTFRFNLTTNTFEASDVVGSTGLIPRATTNTKVVGINNSTIALI